MLNSGDPEDFEFPPLFLPAVPRYNQRALAKALNPCFRLCLPLASAIFCAAGCAAPLGPGYTIEKQEIRVDFVPSPEPHIRVQARYQLRNTGNRPLESLGARLPGHRRFHYTDASATWDGAAISEEPSTRNPRDTELKLPQPWNMASTHRLQLSVEFQPPAAGESTLSFSADAFFLPAEGWSPELLPATGLFGNGGVPPKKWELQVRVPQGFLVHASGGKTKTSRSGGEFTIRAEQTPQDHYPFVIAGHYREVQTGSGPNKIYLWTRTAQEAGELKQSADALGRVLQGYDDAFGNRGKDADALWIVECPVAASCFTQLQGANARLLEYEGEPTNSELVSQDSVVVDLSEGTPKVAVAAAPSLAASWLGYGQNPGFFQQEPPLSALPAFAAAVGREAVEGPSVRTATIHRLLERIPREPAAGKKDTGDVLRAKSLLFFYALQDRCGREVFRKAVREMLEARRGRGFELDDLIAAFDDESHQNTAEFVRLWMKHPGVPGDFRARYEVASAAASHLAEEKKP
jgi:hypothetical protein